MLAKLFSSSFSRPLSPPLPADVGTQTRRVWVKGVDLNHIKSHPNKKGAAKAYKERVAKRARVLQDTD